MSFLNKKLRLYIGLVFLSGAVCLYGLGSNGRAVSMKALNLGKVIEVELKTNKGFGVQKKGPHEIAVYKLSKNKLSKNLPSESDLAAAVSQYGKKIHEEKPLKLSGETSKKDADYLSSVNKFQIPAEGDIVLKAKIYYCSFNDSFCSVDVLYTVLHGK